MPHRSGSRLHARIADQKDALELFVQLHRELMDMKQRLNLPEAVDRIDALLTTNATAIRALSADLAASLARLKIAPSLPSYATAAEL